MDNLKEYLNQATSHFSKYANYFQRAYDDSILLQHSIWWAVCYTGYHVTDVLFRVIFSLDIVQTTTMCLCKTGIEMLGGMMYWLWQHRFSLIFIFALVRAEIDLRNERHETLEALDLGMAAIEEEMEELRQDKVSLERALEVTEYVKERWVDRSIEGWQQLGTKQQEIETLKQEIAKCQEQHWGVGDSS